jgi:uncharacterized protein YcfJ
MKKTYFLIPLTGLAIICSSASYASGGDGHGKKHHKHHHYEERYYPEQARVPKRHDPRSHQGLAGGVVGGVLGYELGNGDPIATGLGAAAGSYLGNGIAGKH